MKISNISKKYKLYHLFTLFILSIIFSILLEKIILSKFYTNYAYDRVMIITMILLFIGTHFIVKIKDIYEFIYEKRYIVAPLGLKVGDTIVSGPDADIKPGNTLPISSIPVGTQIHNIELKPGKGGQLVRSAGNAAQLMAKEDKYAHVRLPSGEVRLIRLECRATIGQIGNLDSENVSIGKAGRTRHMGIKPTVRGSVMNPNDHPHGGGEGKSPVGHPGPMTPWGKPALGYKTRKHKKYSDKLIVKRRNER